MGARGISIFNLIFASAALLITLMVMSGARWAGSPPPRSHPETVRGLIMDLIVFCWFAGAVGLFFRKRLAWVGSIIGVGSSACFFAVTLVTGIGLYFYPNAELVHLKELGGDGHVGGYVFAFVCLVTQFSILLAISLRLTIGLLHMRKDIFGGGAMTTNPALVPPVIAPPVIGNE